MMWSTTIMISDKEQNYDNIDNGEEAPGSDIGSCHLWPGGSSARWLGSSNQTAKMQLDHVGRNLSLFSFISVTGQNKVTSSLFTDYTVDTQIDDTGWNPDSTNHVITTTSYSIALAHFSWW